MAWDLESGAVASPSGRSDYSGGPTGCRKGSQPVPRWFPESGGFGRRPGTESPLTTA